MALPMVLTTAGFSGVIATCLRYMLGYALLKIISAFGIALITFTGVSFAASKIEDWIVSNTSGIGGQFWNVAVALNVPHAIQVITSCYIGAIAIRQLMGFYNRITFGKSE
jgi:hypothetical protein